MAGQQHDQQPQPKSGWLSTIGRALRDHGALITALLALVGVLITQIVTTNNAREGLEAQQALEDARAQTQQDLEEDRAREAELQTYLNDMGEMLLDSDSPLPEAEPGGPMSSLARAKTLTILERLDGQRKRTVLQFLQESQLILKEGPVVSLGGADLSAAELSDADLRDAELSDADLSDADLSDARLRGTSLLFATLPDADLSGAILIEADLISARLNDAFLRNADLNDAFLRNAELRDADLRDAELRDADLSGADLSEVGGVTTEELEDSAYSLRRTTMPDGSTNP
jgi:uncharacterized protein YjbI with pentapeptide repeats